MLLRSQRILTALELYSLVLWVGGLFFLIAFFEPAIRALAIPDDETWRISRSLYQRFGAIQALFAAVVLASNFVKLLLFRRMFELQRFAVLLAAITFTLTLFSVFQVRPELESLHQQLGADLGDSMIQAKFDRRHSQFLSLLKVNLIFGLFLVYAYRTFEERKLQSLVRVLKNPAQM